MKVYWATIKDIISGSTDVKTFLMDIPDDFEWEEGAHTHLALEGFKLDGKPNKDLVHNMSISTLMSEGVVGITTRIKEHCSPYKTILKSLQVGDKVALIKTSSNMLLKKEAKRLYFLSAGVGLATLRPLAIAYLQHASQIKHIHSLNIDSSQEYLFTDVFQTNAAKHFTANFVSARHDFYNEVKRLAVDKEGIYYIVGSDEFLQDNIALLHACGIPASNMMIDKSEKVAAEFLAVATENIAKQQ